MRCAAILAALIILSTVPASAARNFSKYAVLPQPEAPIQITYCQAWITDTDVGNVDYYINSAMTFRDQGDKTATAVRFRLDLYNSFNEHLTSLYGTKEGTFSPDVLIQPRSGIIGTAPDFSWINIWDSSTQVLCSVDTVAFSDGTVWRADFNADVNHFLHPATPTPMPVDPLPAPSLEPPSLVPTKPIHPSTCRVKLSSGQLIDIPWKNTGCASARAKWAKQHVKPKPKPTATPN